MRRSATAAGALLVLLAAAPSASAYPTRVETSYTIGTNAGTCRVTVVASVDPGVAAVDGGLTGIESVHCEALTYTPYYIELSGGFSDTNLDVLDVLEPAEPSLRCQWRDSCYKSRSDGLFPPGDHYVTHYVDIDVAPYAVGPTYTSFPAGCRVAASDRGHLICSFKQWVTMPTPSP
jgi:hypothetical protein